VSRCCAIMMSLPSRAEATLLMGRDCYSSWLEWRGMMSPIRDRTCALLQRCDASQAKPLTMMHGSNVDQLHAAILSRGDKSVFSKKGHDLVELLHVTILSLLTIVEIIICVMTVVEISHAA
jgi:dihydrofolate reductase